VALNSRWSDKLLKITLVPDAAGATAGEAGIPLHVRFFLSPIKALSTSACAATRRAVVLVTLSLCALGVAAQRAVALSPPQVIGQWVTLPYLMSINPIRADLLRNGKVLIVAGSENDPNKHNQNSSKAAVWDLAAQTITVQQMLWDVFCNGGTFFADGRCMVVGGTVEYDPFYGDPRITVFDPLTNKFNQLQSMAHGRWYATAITLGDGRVLAFSGLDETGATNQTVEIYKVASGWSPPYNAGWTPPLYPWLHLLPNGTVFYSGSSTGSRIFDPSVAAANPNTPGSGWTNVGTTYYDLDRPYGNSVLLPLLPPNYAPRVMILGGGSPQATATTEIIDLSQRNPAWAPSGNMPSGARIMGNSVLLPNGKVLALGGSAKYEDLNSATYGADLYTPATSNPPAAIARVQQNNAATGMVAFTSSNTAHNLLVCTVCSQSGVAQSAPTDTLGNTWVLAGTQQSLTGCGDVAIWYVKDCLGGANTVTSHSTGTVYLTVVAEYSGLDTAAPLDQTNFTSNAATTSLFSGSVTTTAANELLVWMAGPRNNATAGDAAWTDTVLTNGFVFQDRIASSTGTYSATGTQTPSGTSIAVIASFKTSGSLGTGSWSSAGTATYARLYHSTAFLLPDATVAVAGSNPDRGTYEQHIEIYSPAYLFTTDANGNTIWATRPVIQGTPASIGYGTGTFQVQTPDAANINSVVLVRPSSVTHAWNMEQRVVGLAFTPSSGALTVNLPPNSNVAPPGYYMLFLLNNAGVPSVASFVQVSSNPTDQPPKGTITAPAGDLTVQAGQAVNFGATAYDPDGFVSAYSWYFPSGTPTTSTVLNPGVVTFPTLGTSVASLTVVDNLGINDPSPPTRTVTVQPAVAVQENNTETGIVAFASSNTAHNLLVCAVASQSGVAQTAPTDTLGNTWVLAGTQQSLTGCGDVAIWYVKDCLGGANTVTSHSYGTVHFTVVAEYSGLNTAAPLDQTHFSSNAASTSIFSGSVTTTAANEILVWMAGPLNNSTAGDGAWTDTVLTGGFLFQDRIASSKGTYSATGTQNVSGTSIAVIASFKP
jgi:hypothetical protein